MAAGSEPVVGEAAAGGAGRAWLGAKAAGGEGAGGGRTRRRTSPECELRWRRRRERRLRRSPDPAEERSRLGESTNLFFLTPHLLVLLVRALPRRRGGAVLALLSRRGAVPVGRSRPLLRLPLLQHLLQVEAAPVVHEEVLHLAHRLVADNVCDGLEVLPVFPDP